MYGFCQIFWQNCDSANHFGRINYGIAFSQTGGSDKRLISDLRSNIITAYLPEMLDGKLMRMFGKHCQGYRFWSEP
jgi:hypothetical protein